MISMLIAYIAITGIIAYSVVSDEPIFLCFIIAILIAVPVGDVIQDEYDSRTFEQAKPVLIDETKRIWKAEMDGEICLAKRRGGADTFQQSPAGQITEYVILECEEK